MNEKIKSQEIKKEFEAEIGKTLELLVENYPRVSRIKKSDSLTEDVFEITIYTVLLNVLKRIQIDGMQLTFNEFHSKYVPNLPILYRYDFTCEEFKEIIDSTYLTERDKKIAHKYFVDKKSVSDVYDELPEVDDRKTISNNLDSINEVLLHRACKYNKEKNIEN